MSMLAAVAHRACAAPRRAARILSVGAPQLFRAGEAKPTANTAALLAAVAGGLLATAAAGKPTAAEPKGDALSSLDLSDSEKKRIIAESLVAAGGAKHSAFVFIKPHAVCENVKELVSKRLEANGMTILAEGVIPAEKIDKDQLIDTHYGAIAAKAVKLKPSELNVQPKAKEQFQKVFGSSWEDALKSGNVYNAMDAAKKLGISTSELGARWGKLKKDVSLLKFGGGFYCGKVDGIFVINGFYMDMRGKFTTPGTSIYYYSVEWDAQDLSWEDFRGNVLGTTDPKRADARSVRYQIYLKWKSLGLKSCPDTGDNGVHASASPFEALAERNNWLGMSMSQDYFGRAMVAAGVPMPMLKAWCDDPAVSFQGKKQSIFDLLEDLNGDECLKKSGEIAAEN